MSDRTKRGQQSRTNGAGSARFRDRRTRLSLNSDRDSYLCSLKYRTPGPAAIVSELFVTPGKHRVQTAGGARLAVLSMPQPVAASGQDTVTVPFPLLWMDKAGAVACT